MAVTTPVRPANQDSKPAAGTTFLGRVATFVLRHRRLVMLGWLVLFLAGAMSAGPVSNRFSYDFSLPGQPGYETALKVTSLYHSGGTSGSSIVVVSAPAGQVLSGSNQELVDAAFRSAQVANPEVRLVDHASTSNPAFVTSGGNASFALVFAPLGKGFAAATGIADAQHDIQQSLPGYQVGVTGLSQLSSGGSSKGPGVLLETIIGGLGALVVLVFVFASFLALIPLVVAAVSIMTTFLVVLGLTYLTDVSFVVQFLIALVGLGVAIDYSLLLVTRWREERARGADNHAAVVTAVETAGRAVVLSGMTVAIGLLALIVIPVPSLRSTGIGGMLIPLVSILVVNTLLPAILGGIGPRIDWPRIRKEQTAGRAWSGWARMIVRGRWFAAIGAAVVLGLLIAPVFSLQVGQTSVSALSQSGDAHAEFQQLTDGGVSYGVLTPLEVLTDQSAGSAVAAHLSAVPGVSASVVPQGPAGNRGGTTDVIVIPTTATLNNRTLAPVRSVEAAVKGEPGVIGVTGDGPIQQDYTHAVFGHFPLMFTLIALITFVLLARAFRSIVLAGKAVVLNLVSLAATFGAVTLFWQEGHGSSSVFSIPATGAVTFWIPLMIFAFLFGLSMDYEVFILTRVREEYDRTLDTNAAVTEGLARTGRLVTSAALILFLAFASLASAPDTDIKVLATGLGAGILLDATIVRALLVPALVSLFGRWNWWMPSWAAKILRVPPSPVMPRGAVVPVGSES